MGWVVIPVHTEKVNHEHKFHLGRKKGKWGVVVAVKVADRSRAFETERTHTAADAVTDNSGTSSSVHTKKRWADASFECVVVTLPKIIQYLHFIHLAYAFIQSDL